MNGQQKSKLISNGQQSFRLVKGYLSWSTVTCLNGVDIDTVDPVIRKN